MGMLPGIPLRHIFLLCCTLLVSIHLYTALRHRAVILPHDADELAWFYHADFFRLFIQGDIRNPAWQSLEAYDHPPITKYLYGAYLMAMSPEYPRDREVFRSTYGSWYDGNIDIFPYDHPAFVPHVQHMRELNSIFGLGALLMAGMLFLRLTGNQWLALGFVYWLGNLTAFQTILVRAVSDAQYLFFFLSAIYTYMVYLQKRRILPLIISAILGALSLSAKLLGGIYFLIVPAFFIFEAVVRRRHFKLTIRDFLILALTGAGVWILLNPTLYPHPFANTLHYLRMRESIMRYQMYEPQNTPLILQTADQRIGYVACTVFHTPFSPRCMHGYLFSAWYLNVAFFLYGLYTLILAAIRRGNREAQFWLICIGVATAFGMTTLLFAWERYLIVHLIIFSCVTFLGIHASIRSAVSRFGTFGRV